MCARDIWHSTLWPDSCPHMLWHGTWMLLKEKWLFFFILQYIYQEKSPPTWRQMVSNFSMSKNHLGWIFKKSVCLEVRPNTLYIKQVVQLIFMPCLLNLQKLLTPTQDNPSSSELLFSLSPWPSWTYQHWPLTTSCQSALLTAIFLLSLTPNPPRYGRTWK